MAEIPATSSPKKSPRWPWACLILAMTWAAIVRIPLILNAEVHLDSDLAVDGLTLVDATRGHLRWHFPGTPHMGIPPLWLAMPQALIFGANPFTIVSRRPGRVRAGHPVRVRPGVARLRGEIGRVEPGPLGVFLGRHDLAFRTIDGRASADRGVVRGHAGGAPRLHRKGRDPPGVLARALVRIRLLPGSDEPVGARGDRARGARVRESRGKLAEIARDKPRLHRRIRGRRQPSRDRLLSGPSRRV